jgi:hypothetical protein
MESMIEHKVSKFLTSEHTDVSDEIFIRCRCGQHLTDKTVDTPRAKPSFMDKPFHRNAFVDEFDRAKRRSDSTVAEVSRLDIRPTPLPANEYIERPVSFIQKLRRALPFGPYTL